MAYPKEAQQTISMMFFILLIISLFWLMVIIVIRVTDWGVNKLGIPLWNIKVRPWLVQKNVLKPLKVTQRRKK